MKKVFRLLIATVIFYMLLQYWSRDYPSVFEFIKSLNIVWTIVGFLSGIGVIYFFSGFKKDGKAL